MAASSIDSSPRSRPSRGPTRAVRAGCAATRGRSRCRRPSGGRRLRPRRPLASSGRPVAWGAHASCVSVPRLAALARFTFFVRAGVARTAVLLRVEVAVRPRRPSRPAITRLDLAGAGAASPRLPPRPSAEAACRPRSPAVHRPRPSVLIVGIRSSGLGRPRPMDVRRVPRGACDSERGVRSGHGHRRTAPVRGRARRERSPPEGGERAVRVDGELSPADLGYLSAADTDRFASA